MNREQAISFATQTALFAAKIFAQYTMPLELVTHEMFDIISDLALRELHINNLLNIANTYLDEVPMIYVKVEKVYCAITDTFTELEFTIDKIENDNGIRYLYRSFEIEKYYDDIEGIFTVIARYTRAYISYINYGELIDLVANYIIKCPHLMIGILRNFDINFPNFIYHLHVADLQLLCEIVDIIFGYDYKELLIFPGEYRIIITEIYFAYTHNDAWKCIDADFYKQFDKCAGIILRSNIPLVDAINRLCLR